MSLENPGRKTFKIETTVEYTMGHFLLIRARRPLAH